MSTSRVTTLPTDSNERKGFPLFRGCFRYFAAALAGVARISKLGNDKHNPGEPMHHARGKSMDHGDCVLRHLMDVEDLLAALERGNTEVTPAQILLEADQMSWRSLAFSQELHERFGAPLAPGAKLPVPFALVEAGWCLERGGNYGKPLEYIYVNSVGLLEWTREHSEALRLARRADADALARIIEDCERVVEHEWVKS